MNSIIALFKQNKFISWIIIFQVFRLLILPFMGLMPQDAYYYMYGQNLDFSYFDHPGMIGYLLRLSSELFGQSILVVKLTDFFVTTITLISVYKLAGLFLKKLHVNKASLLLTSTVFISILSFNSTPDVPLLLFWTLTLICLSKAIFENKKQYWILAGITMGLAFNSKYTAIFLQIGLLLFLVFSKKYQKLLFSKELWFCLLISILVAFPVYWWNYTHDFMSFKFQATSRGGLFTNLSSFPKNLFGLFAHQIVLLLPILFWIFIKLTFKYIKKIVFKRRLPNDKILFLLAFFIPTFLGFISLTPFYWIKLNWLMPSYITGVLLATLFFNKKAVKFQLGFSVAFHLLISVEILFYIVSIKSDDTWIGWEELAIKTKKLQEKYPNTFIFSADNYKTTATLNFFRNQKIYAQNVIGLPALHYDVLNDSLQKLNGKNALFINSDTRFKDKKKSDNYHPNIDLYFDDVIELEPIIVKYNNKEIRKFWVFYCKNYHFKK